MTKVKYVKTHVDDKPVILNMNSCNLCPFLQFEDNDKTTKCSRFFLPFKDISSKITNNVIPSRINGYSYYRGVYAPLTKIEIPYWCKLDDNINDISKVETYVKVDQNNYKVIYDSVKELEVIDYTHVQFDKTNIKLESKKKTTSMVKYNKYSYGYRDRDESKTPPTSNKCSLCGESKSEVERDKRHGMCNNCNDSINNDENKKYISYINNFRLKRKSTWIENVEKKLVNLNIF